MDRARFESSDFGTIIDADDEIGFAWFNPAPIRRDLKLDPQTLLALSRADEALGQLAGIGRLLPNPQLLIGPYAYKEALASARIEGTQADLEDVFQSGRGKPPRSDVFTVNNYRAALSEGFDLIRREGRFDFSVVARVHSLLLGVEGDSALSAVRKRPVWLGSPTDRPETAVYVPPVDGAVTEAIADWNAYLSEPPPLPALVRAAILHYQFLTIHPFMDGNGRAGRLLVLLFLAAEKRLPVPLLYLSPYFEERRREYYDRLQMVRERGELQEWCQFFLTAVEVQAKDGVARADRLLTMRERYRAELFGSRNRAIEVVDMIFENPVLTSSAVRDQLDVTTQGALNLIRGLEAKGWVEQVGQSGRGGAKLWMASEIFDAMTDPIALPDVP